MSADPIQDRVEDVAQRLRRSVVVNDPAVRMRYASRHFGDEDDVRVHAVLQHGAGPDAVRHVLAQGVSTWTGPGWIPAEPGIGMRARLCVPVRRHGELLGLVMVIDDPRTLTDEQVRLVRALADELAVPLLTERLSGAAADAVEAEVAVLVGDLVGDDEARRADAATALARSGALPSGRTLRAIVFAVSAPAEPLPVAAVLRHALAAVGPRYGADLLSAPHGSGATTLVVGPGGTDDATVGSLAADVHTRVSELSAGRLDAVAGLGAEVADAAHAWRSRRQGELAARAVGLLPDRPGPPVVGWDELGVLGLLVRVPDGQWDDTAVPDELGAIDAADAHGRLRATLRAYLDAGGNGPRAAEELRVHRTTLYYRLDRIRELTGLDLDDGGTRLRLHLGLHVRQLLERRAGPST